jgi:hypothetical protein
MLLRLLGRLWAKPPSSPTAVMWPLAFQVFLQAMEDFGAPANRFFERRGSERKIMNSLKSTELSRESRR